MRDGWTTATIGDVAEVLGGSTPRTAIRSYWDGGVPWITPSEVTRQEGAVIAVTDRTLSPEGLAAIGGRLLPAGTVLLTSRATVGAVALAGVPMAVNQGFAALIAGRQVDSTWLMFWCQAHRSDFEALAGGSTYPEVSKPKVREVPIDLPPLAEQRRIVDLVAAVDAAIRTAGEYAAAAAGATRAYLDEGFGAPTAESPPLGDLARLGSGPSWKASDEFSKPGVGTTPVIGIPNTPNGQRLVGLAQRKHVRGLPPSVRRLTPDSLVMIRTNGNRRRIGNIYRVPDAGAGHAYSAFQIGIFPEERRDAPYLFWLLSSPSVQRRISDAASGSTGLGNIAVSWLNRLEVPWPPEVDRMRLCRAADGLEGVCDAINIVQRRFEILRSGLLTELLSGDHEIPAAYDRFLDGAA